MTVPKFVGSTRGISGVARIALTSVLALALSVVALVAGGAPASAVVTTSFSYDCGTNGNDLYTFTASDQFASSENMTRFVIAFVKNGQVDTTVASDIGSAAPTVLTDGTDSLGLGDVPVSQGDTIDVYYYKYSSWPVSNATILASGTKVDSFGYCGVDSATKKATLNQPYANSFTYRNWTGKVSYDCSLNALYSSRTHAQPLPQSDWLAEVVVSGGRAVLTSGYRTFRTVSSMVGPIVPGLSAGDQVDVYAIPYEWLNAPIGAFPRTAFANKVATDPAAQKIYSFNYGSCGSLPLTPPVTPPPPAPVDQCASVPGVQTTPCAVAQNKKVAWPKKSGKSVTYKTRISKPGNTRSFGKWRSVGKSRSTVYKNLAPGTYIVQVEAKPKGKKAKRLKNIVVVVS